MMASMATIVLPVFKVDGYNILDQVEKILEEAGEVQEAIENSEPLRDILLECFDTIQATVNLMAMLKPTEEELDDAFDALLRKHEKRGYIDLIDASVAIMASDLAHRAVLDLFDTLKQGIKEGAKRDEA